MIKKVGNWVFGSFFRTMGRFFFFLFFGFMLAMIISKNNISIKWTDLLGIETIKASEWESVWISPTVKYQINNGSWYNTSVSSDNYHSIYSVSGTNKYRFLFTSQKELTSTQEMLYFTMRLGFSQQESSQSTVNYGCTTWELRNGKYECTNISNSFPSTSTDLEMPLFSIMFSYRYNVNGTVYYKPCIPVANAGNAFTFKCPNTSNAIDGVEVSIYDYYETMGNYSVGIYYLYNIEKSSAGQIIENQNQNQNETISTITDTNTTEADTQANSFFSNFTSQDNGGISSIITAPLSAISGLVSATCTPITLPIPYLDNKQLVLPCMSAIYQEHFGSFFTIYQTIIFGAIAYRIVVSIFMMIQGFKNPDDDKIEVVDL